jgi:hypothetical protein
MKRLHVRVCTDVVLQKSWSPKRDKGVGGPTANS